MCLPALDVARGFSFLRRVAEHNAAGRLLYRFLCLSAQDFPPTSLPPLPLLQGWFSLVVWGGDPSGRGTDFLMVLVSFYYKYLDEFDSF